MSRDMIELQIAASPVRNRIPKDKSLEERIDFAMRYVRKNERDLFWMTGSVTEDLMLRTALAAVMLAGNDEDRAMIDRSMQPLKALSAAIAGIPVDFASIDMDGILPLVKMWTDTAEGGKARKTIVTNGDEVEVVHADGDGVVRRVD